ncbi:RAxF-45 family protein [Falsibacillus pallidus]
MKSSVGLQGQFLEFIYICRAIFHANFNKGISLPFFRNFI